MMWFYILGTLLILFFLFKNIHNGGLYRQYAQKAAFAFDDKRSAFKISQIVFRVVMVIAALILFALLFVWHDYAPAQIVACICLILGGVLFGFFPFSAGRWALTTEGIFIYNYGIFLPWGKMIHAEILPRRKKTFIIVTVKKLESEHFKKTTYPLLVPGPQAVDICNMIKEFITTMQKKRYRQHINEERAAAARARHS